jgi:hypothetical protein
MKNLFDVLFLIILAGIVLIFPNSASACTCDEYFTPPCAAYWRADVVFIGTVGEVTGPTKELGDGLPRAIIQFHVEKSFRGAISKKAEIEILLGSCDYGLKPGEKYLVYANRKYANGHLELRPCTRTRPLADAATDLTYINSLNQEGHRSISGMITGLKQSDLDGGKVIVKGDRESFECLISATGHYSIDYIQPGNYYVQISLPFEVEFISGSGVNVLSQSPQTMLEYKTTLAERQCDYREVQLAKIDRLPSATISGVVVDEKGMPVPNTFIHLYPALPNQDFSFIDYEAAKTDAIGRYTFNKLRIGQYLLGINLINVPNFDTPYPKTFFPGVTSRSKARIITVSQNQHLSLQPFVLLPKLTEGIVKGRLIWTDGTPVTKLYLDSSLNEKPILYLIDPNNIKGGSLNPFKPDGTNTIQIDEQGRFSFVGYEGQTYVIHAHAFNAQNEPMHAKHLKVNITKNIKPIELVLSIPGTGKSVEVINKEISN